MYSAMKHCKILVPSYNLTLCVHSFDNGLISICNFNTQSIWYDIIWSSVQYGDWIPYYSNPWRCICWSTDRVPELSLITVGVGIYYTVSIFYFRYSRLPISKSDIELNGPSIWDAYGTQNISG